MSEWNMYHDAAMGEFVIYKASESKVLEERFSIPVSSAKSGKIAREIYLFLKSNSIEV